MRVDEAFRELDRVGLVRVDVEEVVDVVDEIEARRTIERVETDEGRREVERERVGRSILAKAGLGMG